MKVTNFILISQLCQYHHFLQKFGSCWSLLSKFWYHCCRQEKGTNDSPDLPLISPPDTAKLLAKLNRFSTIFWPNSMNVDTLAASVWAAGVWPSSVMIGSTEIPTMALLLLWPRFMKLFDRTKFSSWLFSRDILERKGHFKAIFLYKLLFSPEYCWRFNVADWSQQLPGLFSTRLRPAEVDSSAHAIREGNWSSQEYHNMIDAVSIWYLRDNIGGRNLLPVSGH